MENIYVTRPSLPDLKEYHELLEQIWSSRWLTNEGSFHKKFEKELVNFLEAENLSLFTNGTIALVVGLQALRITGEVITTPYSFVATTHALHWNGITPVFCDIEEETFNIDPDKIESLITPKTTAIMPVHVYGNPCNTDKIQKIADTYGLKVIYDAAHAFGVKNSGKSIVNHGDLTILSFHATKAFNTVEGGAIVCKDPKLKKRIDYLKNFGFADEITVVAPGINGKMNELIAAYGLLQLRNFEEQIKMRCQVADYYKKLLVNIEGITSYPFPDHITSNYSYFPILVKPEYPETRDQLYERLQKYHILTRRYFYPLISDFPTYRALPSANKEYLPVASKIADQVLCLPIYSDLTDDHIQFIAKLIRNRV